MQLDSSPVLLQVFLALFTLDFQSGINYLFIVPQYLSSEEWNAGSKLIPDLVKIKVLHVSSLILPLLQ